MPLIVGQWKMDNFFERPKTAMLPNTLHDCYFYYYSTCNKGESCEYRHEPIALGHEEMCPMWVDGLCYDIKCKNRHMFIKKNRSRIPCFFESQPSGCNKPHCVFKHTRKFGQMEGNIFDENNNDAMSELRPPSPTTVNNEGVGVTSGTQSLN